MELLWFEPHYAEILHKEGLVQLDDFLHCSRAREFRIHRTGARSVALLRVGPITAYLKREFRISYKEKFRNWWDRFGKVGKSVREWKMLQRAQQAGFVVPLPLACGQRGHSAFLLTAELVDFIPLDKYVAGASERELRLLQKHLPQWLACWHDSGFIHPDLYAWHVFVRVTDQQLAVLDLARAAHAKHVSWRERCYELALLGASLDNAARANLAWEKVLDTYLRAAGVPIPSKTESFFRATQEAVNEQMKMLAAPLARRRSTEKESLLVNNGSLYPLEAY